MTVYNNAPYICEAIRSALGQTYPHLEVVVVDDGSDDGSWDEVCKFPEVRARKQDRGGIGAARNLAVSMAQGDFFTFLDADDRFPPDKLEIQLRAFAAEPELEVTYGYVREFVSPDLTAEEAARIRPAVDRNESHLSGVMLIRRAAFERVGPWTVGLKVGTGVDWYARSQEAGLRTSVLPDVLLERRLHLSNNGLRQADNRIQYAAILKAALDRRRAATAQPDRLLQD
ncbi:glycosyltransferase family A protein [Intrasporangium chromatireducens]|nr:glycosyltransferase family A protein [Intrasporangium chromatireducens]